MRLVCIILLSVITLKSPIGVPHGKGHPAHDSNHADADERGTKESPMVVQVVGAQSAEEKAAQEKKRYDADADDKRHTLWLTIVIALAAVSQAVAVAWQVVIYQNQSRLMLSGLRINRMNANASLTSAKAALAAVDLGSDTAKRQLRAYLCVSKGRLNLTSEGYLEPMLTLVNGGQTPAYDVTTLIHAKIEGHPHRGPLKLPADADQMQSVSIIAPHGTETMVSKRSRTSRP